MENTNKLISDFMGETEIIEYTSNFGVLMNVLEKIEGTSHIGKLGKQSGKAPFGIYTIYSGRCIIHCYFDEFRVNTVESFEKNTQKAIYKAVVEYLEWDNEVSK